MGSDLANRPSDNEPINRDSSVSDKSKDSSRINGVWKSGSNCEIKNVNRRPVLSRQHDNLEVSSETGI